MISKKKRFAKVNIEISNICNLQCSFCPEVVRAKKQMSLQQFESIIQQVAPLTDLVCLHLMGEPLAHPKLAEFIEICSHHQVRVFLVSNGVLLRVDKMDLLLHPIIQQVNFSLHSFKDNFPEKDPTRYLEKIFTFTERAFVERPDLYINFRVWSLADALSQATGQNEILSKVSDHFRFDLPNEIDVRKRKSFRVKNRLYLHFDTEFIWPSLELPELGERGTCHGLSSHFGILADGTVVPCCLDKEGKIPLGHIDNSSIVDILDGERAQAILKGFKAKKLQEDLCKRCQYITRFKV